MRHLIISIITLALALASHAASTSDSIIVDILKKEHNINFTNNNSITLLKSGQEKFDDLFKAVKQARSSIHLEYFNFRNDSIAFELFNLLKKKAAEGVEIRALYDGFGNDSNNKPLKKKHIKQLLRNLESEIVDLLNIKEQELTTIQLVIHQKD